MSEAQTTRDSEMAKQATACMRGMALLDKPYICYSFLNSIFDDLQGSPSELVSYRPLFTRAVTTCLQRDASRFSRGTIDVLRLFARVAAHFFLDLGMWRTCVVVLADSYGDASEHIGMALSFDDEEALKALGHLATVPMARSTRREGPVVMTTLLCKRLCPVAMWETGRTVLARGVMTSTWYSRCRPSDHEGCGDGAVFAALASPSVSSACIRALFPLFMERDEMSVHAVTRLYQSYSLREQANPELAALVMCMERDIAIAAKHIV
jgi:hypothetical protein